MLIRSATAAHDDFLSGLPMRAGMASGEARRVGGRGRSLPCGCSDGPAASLQAASQDALLEAERLHQRHLIAQLDEKLLDEPCAARSKSATTKRMLDRHDEYLKKTRKRAAQAERLVGELEHSNRIGWSASARSLASALITR